MGKLLDHVVDLFALVAAILVILVMSSVGYVIFARVVGASFPVWIVQFNEYALLWITFLGTAWVLGRNRHISIDLLTRHLKPRAKAVFDVAHSAVGCGLCAVLSWFSLSTVRSMFQRGIMDVGAVDVPKYLVLLVIPLGFLLLTLQFLRKIVTGFGTSAASESVEAETERANAVGPE